MYKVSVIVPVYNGEKFIGKMLGSLVGQTLGKDLQIVVVDDGSCDKSLDIIREFESAHSNMTVCHTDNHGAAHARNVGLDLARGEYIGFADCDDYVDLAMYEKLYNRAVEENADIATCGYLRVDGFDIQRRDYVNRRCFGFNLYQSPSLLRRNVPYNVTKLIKRSLIEDEHLRYFDDLRVYEDMVFSYMAFLKANKIVKLSECPYVYNYSREGSLTYEFSEKRFDLFTAFRRLVDYYKANDAFVCAEDELLRIFLLHVYVALEGRYNRNVSVGYRPSDFFNSAVSFLDEVFPWWRHYDAFYKQTKRNQFLYTKGGYLAYRRHRPKSLIDRERRSSIEKRFLSSVRVGAVYAAEIEKTEVNRNAIIIDSQRGENLSGNMFYLLKELISNETYNRFVIGLTYMKPSHLKSFKMLLEAHELLSDQIVFLKYNSERYAKYLASAGFIFTDTSMPVYFNKRAEQVYANTWHGTPLKALGRDMQNGFEDISNLTKNFTAADFLFFQNGFMKEKMERAYMYEGGDSKTYLYGYPRNEAFFDSASRLDVRKMLEVNDKQVIGYLPTWRGKARSNASRPEVTVILEEIDAHLSDSQVMLAKLHHYDASSIDFSRFHHIRPFPVELETYETLNACDTLVTDYSSVMFDYATTRRKIILFAYDRDSYYSDRGFYLKLEDLHIPIAETVDELIFELGEPVKETDANNLFERFCAHESKDCSKRILETVFSSSKPNRSHARYRVNLMVYAGNLIYPTSRDAVRPMLQSLASTNTKIAFSYDMNLLANEFLLKDFDQRIEWRGVAFPFSAATVKERELVALASSDPSRLSRHRSELNSMIEREKARAFPSTEIDTSLVFGNESILNLLMACMGSKSSVLVIDDCDYYSHVPQWIIAQFTRVFGLEHDGCNFSFVQGFSNFSTVSAQDLNDALRASCFTRDA